jgi:uncharacterized membrane protein
LESIKNHIKTKAINFLESINTSFWFLPSLMAFLAVLLSWVTLFIDQKFPIKSVDNIFSFLYTWQPAGARLILSTIATSTMTVIGVVFSITIVAMVLAASQFGPRLLRNFMKDKGHQIVLGTFIATFIYCILILRLIRINDQQTFVPSISITIAVMLSLTSIGVLIFFIHHICTSIRADLVVSDIYQDLLDDMQRLFPEEIGKESQLHSQDEVYDKKETSFYRHSLLIRSKGSGYLRAIENNGLMKIAKKFDLLLNLHLRPGDFTVENSALVTVKYNKAIDNEIINEITSSFIFGYSRTPKQDAEFAIHQLVEVAVRALSPGINDPYTAMSCIDYLAAALSCLAKKKFPSAFRFDHDGNIRIIARPFTFDGLIRAAFDQIRQYSKSNVGVIIRLLEALAQIGEQAKSMDSKQAILRQSIMIERMSRETISEKNDLEDIENRFQTILQMLN